MQHTAVETENIELDLLLEGIHRQWGYDFRSYARASLKRRITKCMEDVGLDHLSEMVPRVLHDKAFFDAFLKNLSVTITEMFRDPTFYRALRKHLVDHLKTYPFIKIWHAGCATGEEAYSMAILLQEEGLLDRATIYATDYNDQALDRAKGGMYALEKIQQYTANYVASGGTQSFSDYYRARYGSAKMDPALTERITFSHHNLVTDGVFGEMNVVICRNVLIYFDKTLQNRTLALFADSLCRRGFLCLGSKETLEFSSVSNSFESVAKKEKIYRKVREPEVAG